MQRLFDTESWFCFVLFPFLFSSIFLFLLQQMVVDFFFVDIFPQYGNGFFPEFRAYEWYDQFTNETVAWQCKRNENNADGNLRIAQKPKLFFFAGWYSR